MGGNVCKELEINATKTIGTKDLEALWQGYAKGKKTLDYDDGCKFLKDLAAAIGTQYDKRLGDRWFKYAANTGSGTLDYDSFIKVFTLASKDTMNFSQSLVGKLDFDLELPNVHHGRKTGFKTTIHKGIKCNNCQAKPIEGFRYKCHDCYLQDYNLCSACEVNAESIHNPNHNFIKFKQPSEVDYSIKPTRESKQTDIYANMRSD